MIAARYATWPSVGSASISPVARSRQSETPCHRGVAQAIGSSQSGRFSIGKNVPEKRKMGRRAKRKTAVIAAWFSMPPASAAIGAANARPQKTAASGVSTASGERNAPAIAATQAKSAAAAKMRAAAHESRPLYSSRTRTGWPRRRDTSSPTGDRPSPGSCPRSCRPAWRGRQSARARRTRDTSVRRDRHPRRRRARPGGSPSPRGRRWG